MARGRAFVFIQVTGWLLLVYLVYAQGISALNYDYGVAMGTQEPAEKITEVGAAFWYGFALGDAVFYMPLLLAGLIGMAKDWHWGRGAMIAAMGITVYWPIVCLVAIATARGAPGWTLPKETEYWIVLPIIAVWAAWVLWWLIRPRDRQA
jgi:hypothetical protein